VSGTTYWEIVQSFLKESEFAERQFRQTISIKVPVENTLDPDGLMRLRNRTKRRFEDFEAQREGAEFLIEELQKNWGVKIDMVQRAFWFCQKVHFQPDPTGRVPSFFLAASRRSFNGYAINTESTRSIIQGRDRADGEDGGCILDG